MPKGTRSIQTGIGLFRISQINRNRFVCRLYLWRMDIGVDDKSHEMVNATIKARISHRQSLINDSRILLIICKWQML